MMLVAWFPDDGWNWYCLMCGEYSIVGAEDEETAMRFFREHEQKYCW